MPRLDADLGRYGALLDPTRGIALADDARRLEDLGFPTLWLPGGPLESLDQVAEVIQATRAAKVATSIIPVDRFPAKGVAELYADHADRLVVGLGGAHGPKPLATLSAYFDELDDAVPQSARLLSALGPRMLDLARERAAGAIPVLVTPGYSEHARVRLGDDATLAVMQLVVVEPDPDTARTIARVPLGFLSQAPSYQAHLGRMGFTDEEVAGLDDRLVDALSPWGDAATVAARVAEHLPAGADHVIVSVTNPTPEDFADAAWTGLAAALAL